MEDDTAQDVATTKDSATEDDVLESEKVVYSREPESVSLCQRCIKIFELMEEKRDYEEVIQVQDLSSACALCVVLLREMNRVYRCAEMLDEKHGSDRLELHAEHHYGSFATQDAPEIIKIDVRPQVSLPVGHKRSVYVTCIKSNSSSSIAAASWQHFPTSFEEKMHFVRKCLNRCDQQHHACQASRSHILPGRLIELARTDQDSAHLVRSDQVKDRNISYLCLSYCWGHTTMVKLTQNSRREFHTQLPREDLLPTVYQDTFKIARAVGCRYVWIDALCIVQDDLHDWTVEAAKMYDIYAGSYLTVIASEGDSASKSWMQQRPPHLIYASDINSYQDVDTMDKFIIKRFFVEACLPNGSSLRAHIRPLKQLARTANEERGWTLQETLLCHRSIQVTDSELIWRCREVKQGEVDGATDILGYIPTRDLLFNEFRQEDWQWDWRTWVADYSKRFLTRESDRLPALRGLISAMKIVRSGEPCLGLWSDTLAYDLTWTVFLIPEAVGDDELNLPTWSPLRHSSFFLYAYDEDCANDCYESCTSLSGYDEEWEDQPYVSRLISCRLEVYGPIVHFFFPVLQKGDHLEGVEPAESRMNSFAADQNASQQVICHIYMDHVMDDRIPPKNAIKPCLLLCRAEKDTTAQAVREIYPILEQIQESSSDLLEYRRIGLGVFETTSPTSSGTCIREFKWQFDMSKKTKIVLR